MSLRAWLYVGAVAAFLALGLFAWREHDNAVKEHARADAEAKNAELARATVQTVDRWHTDTKTIIQRSEAKADAVQAIPSPDVPADVLSGWRSGLSNDTAPNPGSPAKPSG